MARFTLEQRTSVVICEDLLDLASSPHHGTGTKALKLSTEKRRGSSGLLKSRLTEKNQQDTILVGSVR